MTTDDIQEQLNGLRKKHRHAEMMRREMVGRLNEVAKCRDYWEKESSEVLSELMKCEELLEKEDRF